MTVNQAQIAMITAAVIAALNAPKGKAKHKPQSSYKPANKFTPKHQDGLSDRQITNDVKVAKAFKKAGFIVVPRVDALTYKGWLLKGQRVVKGQHGIFVKGVGTLFHSGQVAPDMPISLITGQPVVQAIA
jgi:hypothetical protein